MLPLAFLAADYLAAEAPTPRPEPSVVETAPPALHPATTRLSAAWQANALLLTGLSRGADIRVYDVVGHVLAEFRSESPEARLQLARRQLVAVCAGGDCVGAR